jgi:hypothetical protein
MLYPRWFSSTASYDVASNIHQSLPGGGGRGVKSITGPSVAEYCFFLGADFALAGAGVGLGTVLLAMLPPPLPRTAAVAAAAAFLTGLRMGAGGAAAEAEPRTAAASAATRAAAAVPSRSEPAVARLKAALASSSGLTHIARQVTECYSS